MQAIEEVKRSLSSHSMECPFKADLQAMNGKLTSRLEVFMSEVSKSTKTHAERIAELQLWRARVGGSRSAFGSAWAFLGPIIGGVVIGVILFLLFGAEK